MPVSFSKPVHLSTSRHYRREQPPKAVHLPSLSEITAWSILENEDNQGDQDDPKDSNEAYEQARNTWFRGGSKHQIEDISLDANLLDQLHKENVSKQNEYREARTFIKRGLSFFKDEISKGEETCEGDKILNQIFYLLDTIMSFKQWKREEAQVKLHKAYIIASLPLIYGKSWDTNAARVLARFKVKSLKSLVLALFPRRYGKTIAIACFNAVMLVTIRGIVISTFSTGKRASSGVMAEVLNILSGHPDIVARIVKQNEEKLQIAFDSNAKRNDKDTATFNSYPSNPKVQTIQHIFTHRHIHIHIHEEGRKEEKRIPYKKSVITYIKIIIIAIILVIFIVFC
jgi:hypothetical protein